MNAYDWVRMSEFDFGGGPVGLRWMGLYACNMLSRDNALDMYNKGVRPMNPSLNILLAEETSIYIRVEFGTKWASFMNGGEDGRKHTVIDSWVSASEVIHKLVNPVGHTVIMRLRLLAGLCEREISFITRKTALMIRQKFFSGAKRFIL